MWKLLIGPASVGVGYAVGAFYGRDAEQLVHKSPSETFAGVADALARVRESGTTDFEGGTPMAYSLQTDSTPDQKMVLHLSFAGREGAQQELLFTPVDDGKATLITARVHTDHDVLRTALAGTSRAKLAYAPDWMLNLTMRPVLKQLAEQIEQGRVAGDALGDYSPGEAEARWEAQQSPEQRSQAAQWQQYQATQPMTDPDADAQRKNQPDQSEQN